MYYSKKYLFLFLLVFALSELKARQAFKVSLIEGHPSLQNKMFHNSENSLFDFTGRIENNELKRFWQPGVTVTMKIKGSLCEVFLNDEELYGNSHNYIEVIVDAMKPVRLQTIAKNNKLIIEGLNNNHHIITICKNTEAGIGYLEFAGINCKKLLKLPAKPTRKIEFIGNSITCGSGMDLSLIPCSNGKWYDQHNAYLSYGPLAARSLQSQWSLSSVSGIGMIHSCCNMNITMPQVFDKIDMRDDSIEWNFNLYIPDVVTICLGQNDGIQDSTIFCNAYISFIKDIRNKYANADIICLTSPMGDEKLTTTLKNYLTSIVNALNNSGDKKIYKYFFSKQYHNGCGGHPDLKDHEMIAAELTGFIKNLEHW